MLRKLTWTLIYGLFGALAAIAARFAASRVYRGHRRGAPAQEMSSKADQAIDRAADSPALRRPRGSRAASPPCSPSPWPMTPHSFAS